MKKLIFTVLLACLALNSCSRSEYRNDVACNNVTDGIREELSDEQTYDSFDATHIELYFDDAEFDNCSLIYSAPVEDINEVGVFHAKDEDAAKELLEDCREYIEDMQENSRAFIASYAPEELPKLDSAEARRFGKYVVYTILPTDKTEAVFDRAEKLLRAS